MLKYTGKHVQRKKKTPIYQGHNFGCGKVDKNQQGKANTLTTIYNTQKRKKPQVQPQRRH